MFWCPLRPLWIQDLKKEGAQGVRWFAPKIILANLGDLLNNLVQKGMGVRPLSPPLDPRLEAFNRPIHTHTH